MNLPGLDWATKTIKPNSSYKAIHLQIVNMLYKHNLYQMVTEPTHIHGNTLDLIYLSNTLTTDPPDVVIPGLSDHYIITLKLKVETIMHQQHKCKNTKEIFVYQKANVQVFTEKMTNALHQIKNLSDVHKMWDIYKRSLDEAILDSVHTQKVQTNCRSILLE